MKINQCLLASDKGWWTVAWIEKKNARVGNYVPMLRDKYAVVAIYPPTLTLKEKKDKEKKETK